MLNLVDTIRLLKAGYTKKEIEEMSAAQDTPAADSTQPADDPAPVAADEQPATDSGNPAPAPTTDIAEQIRAAVADAMAQLHLDNIAATGDPADSPKADGDPVGALVNYFNGRG